jgi:hypothetical protein
VGAGVGRLASGLVKEGGLRVARMPTSQSRDMGTRPRLH